MLFLGNLYAGYVVALYRQRPTALVCSVSAVMPILGPLLFLSLPTMDRSYEEPPPMDTAIAAREELSAPLDNKGPSGPGIPSGGGLSLKQQTGAVAKGNESKVYRRGEYTINRQFVERTFAGFFRVVPGEAEKDMVLVVKGPRSEFLCRRITRISATDIHLLLVSGGEKSIALGEIGEIRLKHKDDRS
jgi:hypothetical protein